VSFAAPWALLGLLALPVIWWLHRRLRRPPVLDLPSLMFLQDEEEAHALPRGRRIDAELLLALGAALCLVLAAAGLTIERGSVGRTVRVVAAGGVAAKAEGYGERVQAALAEIRAALDGDDRLEVVREPPGELAASGRPSVDALLAAARAGRASARIVIADRAPGTDTGDVAWVAVGNPRASNQALVAVHVADDGASLFCNLLSDADRGVVVQLVGGTGDAGFAVPPLRLAPGRLESVVVPLPADLRAAGEFAVELRTREGEAWRDALRADDRVRLTRRPLRAYLDPSLPAAHRDRARHALVAALGEDGLQVVDGPWGASLAVVARGQVGVADARIVLELEPVAEGDAVERAPPGDDGVGRDPIVRDLSTAGVDWVYRSGAHVPDENEIVLLARGPGDAWPVVLQLGPRVRLAPDPMRGERAAADAPFWPLLIDNLATAAGRGRDAGAGYRADGVLDDRASTLGRARIPFDRAVLDAAPPAAAAEARTLRPLLTVAALALLALLWAAPWLRRRLGNGAARMRAARA
jgi:hypothetical protein